MCLEISQQSVYKTETLKGKELFFKKMRKSRAWVKFLVSFSSFFFFLHKLKYQLWVPPSPECLTQTSNTHNFPRREENSSLAILKSNTCTIKIFICWVFNNSQTAKFGKTSLSSHMFACCWKGLPCRQCSLKTNIMPTKPKQEHTCKTEIIIQAIYQKV